MHSWNATVPLAVARSHRLLSAILSAEEWKKWSRHWSLGNGQVDSFKSAFEDESSSGTYACKREGRETKMMLTTENRNNRRFYMLCYQGNAAYANGDVTIIIKYLKK
jgi:hypothetical protein